MAAVVSSRRFACDRCRDQKLKCLRERLDPDRCDRCLRANSECVTTPTSIARSSPANPPSTNRKRKHPGQRPTPSTTHASMDSLTDVATLRSTTGSAEWPQAWDGLIHNMDCGDGFDDMMMPSLDPELFTASAATSAYALLPPQSTSPFDLTPGEDEGGTREDPGQTDARKRNSEPVGLSLGGVLRSGTAQSSSSENYSPGSCIHRLSGTNLSLIAQLSRIDQGPPGVTLDMLISRLDESDPSSTSPVEDMLSSTREFIQVLEVVSGGPASSSGPSSPGRVSNSNSSESPTNLSSKTLDGNRSVDITTLLLVLSCYVQVLRLYVILFSHLHQFLQEIAESDDPTLCPLPDMGFGNFMVESGNLQATLFIQIIMSLFERLESLIGLPSELRITMRVVDRGGLFVDKDFQSVVKTVLSKDEVGRPENGKGGVASLRKHMKDAVRLLRESIAP
ncbi:hypothetical protein F5Y10DRAFT_208032 [Nemania abortiva]|nr:hypothetical protein F5Y10DRAFT_208032 [Nemania abortiva]